MSESQDVKSLLAELDHGWNEVREALDRLPSQELRRPQAGSGWSALDHLGHLATWADICARGLPELVAGRSPAVETDWESYNQTDRAEKALWEDARVRDFATRAHGDLRAAVATLSDSDLDVSAAVWGETMTVRDWVIAEGPVHYREHAATLRGDQAAPGAQAPS